MGHGEQAAQAGTSTTAGVGRSTAAFTEPRSPRPQPSFARRVFMRWTAITTLMAAFVVLYTRHPYYLGNQFQPFRSFFLAAFCVWLVLGPLYVRATLRRFGALRHQMRDGGLHLLLLVRAAQRGRFWRTVRKPRLRTTVLGIVVKAFFTPLMVGFVAGHMNGIANAWLKHKGVGPLELKVPGNLPPLQQASLWWAQARGRLPDLVPHGSDFAGLLAAGSWTRSNVSWGLGLAYDLVFFVDCAFALLGYASESRWLGNKTRSVEPTAFGWLVCLGCYPPFNNVLGTYLPLPNGPAIITGETALLVLRGFTVVLFAIYASATVAFGFKFSNLTNRGIVRRGPYRFVRHPAYLCKCTAWWLEHLPTLTLTKAFFLTLLCGWYALRAFTEERHLSADPDYRAYKKKTPWVLLPGIY